MEEKREIFGQFTRRGFLHLGAAGMAGMVLAGIPKLGDGAEKKPKYGGRMRVA